MSCQPYSAVSSNRIWNIDNRGENVGRIDCPTCNGDGDVAICKDLVDDKPLNFIADNPLDTSGAILKWLRGGRMEAERRGGSKGVATSALLTAVIDGIEAGQYTIPRDPEWEKEYQAEMAKRFGGEDEPAKYTTANLTDEIKDGRWNSGPLVERMTAPASPNPYDGYNPNRLLGATQELLRLILPACRGEYVPPETVRRAEAAAAAKIDWSL